MMQRKKTIMLAALVLLFAGALAQKRQVMLDRVVAVVGNSSILYSEVDEAEIGRAHV